MTDIIIKGDLKSTAGLETALRDAFNLQSWSTSVDIESSIQDVALGPGEMGFGEELRQILVGLGDLLSAVPDATKLLAEGIRNRVTPRTNVNLGIGPDGTITLDFTGGGGVEDIASLSRELAAIVGAARSGHVAPPANPTTGG